MRQERVTWQMHSVTARLLVGVPAGLTQLEALTNPITAASSRRTLLALVPAYGAMMACKQNEKNTDNTSCPCPAAAAAAAAAMVNGGVKSYWIGVRALLQTICCACCIMPPPIKHTPHLNCPRGDWWERVCNLSVPSLMGEPHMEHS
jgi:hypothetical protein